MNDAPFQWRTFGPAALDAWNRFFHAPANLKLVAILRTVYATLILINAAALFPYLNLWFSETGVFPRAIAAELSDPQQWSALNLLPATDAVLGTAFALWVTHAFLLLLGYSSRINAFGCYFWLIAFQHRTQFLWDGEDQVMRLIGFYLLFMPWQHVPGWNWRCQRIATPSEPVSGWAVRLLQLQMCIIFLDTAGSKIHGSMWQDGTALYYASRLDDFFCPDWVPHFIYNTPWMVKSITWFVLAAEFLIPILLWFKETRRISLVIAVIFHLGCMWSMNLFLFHPIMLCGWLSFVTQEDLDAVRRAWRRLGERRQSLSIRSCASTQNG